MRQIKYTQKEIRFTCNARFEDAMWLLQYGLAEGLKNYSQMAANHLQMAKKWLALVE